MAVWLYSHFWNGSRNINSKINIFWNTHLACGDWRGNKIPQKFQEMRTREEKKSWANRESEASLPFSPAERVSLRGSRNFLSTFAADFIVTRNLIKISTPAIKLTGLFAQRSETTNEVFNGIYVQFYCSYSFQYYLWKAFLEFFGFLPCLVFLLKFCPIEVGVKRLQSFARVCVSF